MTALIERWRRAEALGWDSLWISDHTPAQFPGEIVFEAWSLLGAMARETSTIRIGALVSPVAFRHPTLLAMSAVTVDHLSNGRLEIGLGAGGGKRDAGALGHPALVAKERLERLDEQLSLLDRLLRGQEVDHAGAHYRTTVKLPPPIQLPRPPLMVAAQGPRALRLVAKHADAWNTLGQLSWVAPVSIADAIAETKRRMRALDDACAQIGRDPRSVRRSVNAFRATPDPFTSVDDFIGYVERYREIGIEEFIFYWPEAAQEEILERVSAEVLGPLRHI